MSKPRHQKFDAPFADAEEADIMRAVEGGEFSEAEPLPQAKKAWREAARAELCAKSR